MALNVSITCVSPMAKRNKDPLQDIEITTESEDEKEDSDGPRVVQWVDEEDLVQEKSDDSSDNEEESENEGSDDERGMVCMSFFQAFKRLI